MGDHVRPKHACNVVPTLLTFRSFVRLQVNYLSTALLSILMLPHLIKSTTPSNVSRLVIVSSEAHFLANKLKGATNWPSILGKLNDKGYCTAS